MSVVADIGTAARSLAARIDGAVVHIGTDHRGSGVVIAPGKVVTNAHNLRDRSTQVSFADGRTAQATVAGADLDGDLVVLDVDTGSIEPVPLPASAEGDGAEATAGAAVGLGDLVYAAGRAKDGLRLTVGFVSGTERSFRGPRGRRIAGSIEHSAPLARGASGGPLFSSSGQLVGINTHRIGRGFYLARPTDATVVGRLTELQAGRSVAPRTLGVALTPNEVATRLRRAVGLAEREGLLVRQVASGSPAARAGLAEGDLLVAAAGEPLRAADDLHQALATVGEDEALALSVVRGVEELAITVSFRQDEPAADGSDRSDGAEAP